MISIIYQSVLSNLFGFIGPILDVGIKEIIEIINKFVYHANVQNGQNFKWREFK